LFFYSQSIVTTRVNDTVTHWKSKNSIGIDLNEMAFMNWSAGGNSSVSGLLKGNFVRRYSDEKIKWNNELIIRYGVNMQDGLGLRKTDDALQFNSTFGHRKDSLSNWYTSAKLNFNTQFTDGYAYPNTEIAISKPFAPAYFFLGIGTEYVNKDKKIVLYLSPLTSKSTLVLDQRLADQGAFGVVKAVYDSNGNLLLHGRKSKNELGVLVTAMHKKEVMKNVMLENRLSLYSDYINNFGNIDVDWQLQMDLLVNKYVKANIGLHLLYDDDIKAKEQINGEQVIVGPKLQLKQALGVGFVYNFKV
jgi:hypothetical protein